MMKRKGEKRTRRRMRCGRMMAKATATTNESVPYPTRRRRQEEEEIPEVWRLGGEKLSVGVEGCVKVMVRGMCWKTRERGHEENTPKDLGRRREQE
jgi:hypothetical protein